MADWHFAESSARKFLRRSTGTTQRTIVINLDREEGFLKLEMEEFMDIFHVKLQKALVYPIVLRAKDTGELWPYFLELQLYCH
jgi:hypothetical protein